MKAIKALLFIAVCVMIPLGAFAQDERGMVQTTDSVSIRDAAVLTQAAVLSTTFTVAELHRCKAIHYYIDFTTGSLTSATFIPAGAVEDNPAATGYYGNSADGLTLTTSGRYHIRCPIPNDGAAMYHGIFARGQGTVTDSSAAIYYKLEY